MNDLKKSTLPYTIDESFEIHHRFLKKKVALYILSNVINTASLTHSFETEINVTHQKTCALYKSRCSVSIEVANLYNIKMFFFKYYKEI